MSELPPIVLVFAASDPSGGAGLQADIMTLSSMGCHPLSVVTAVTMQDTMGVDDVSPIDAEWVADQARCVLEDMPVAAFKIGLLGSVETDRGDRRSRVRLSRRAARARSGARFGPRRRARRRRKWCTR